MRVRFYTENEFLDCKETLGVGGALGALGVRGGALGALGSEKRPKYLESIYLRFYSQTWFIDKLPVGS